MPKQSPDKIMFLVLLIALGLSLGFARDSFAETEGTGLSQLQELARTYREEGLALQNIGNLDDAMSLYQKAIGLDPSYAPAYNDLGIVLEAKGLSGEAEQYYLKAIAVDPGLLSAYSNLAIIYENKRDLDKALYYWDKRAQLGVGTDPWTQKARQRSRDIEAVAIFDTGENNTLNLVREIEAKKQIERNDNSALAKDYFRKAKLCNDKGQDLEALKLAINAMQLDPSNSEISDFVDKVQLRLLSK